MSSYFSLYIIILFIQNFPVKSCDSQGLSQTIWDQLNRGQGDQAAENIGRLSNCDKDALKDTVQKAKSWGLTFQARLATHRADRLGWGNSAVLRECLAILCEGGTASRECDPRSPVIVQSFRGHAQAEESLQALFKDAATNALTAAYAEVVQCTDVAVALENSVKRITSTTVNFVIETYQQRVDGTSTQAIVKYISEAIVRNLQVSLVSAAKPLFQKCPHNTLERGVSAIDGIMNDHISGNAGDVITTTPPISQEALIQDFSDFFAQVATDTYIYFGTQILSVVDDTCSV